jgi:integrase
MARLRKISGNYYAYFRDRSRDPKEKSWPLRVSEQRAARRKLSDLEEGFEQGEFDPWAGGWLKEDVTIEESVKRFLDAKEPTVSDRTLDTYEQQLEALLNTLPDAGDSPLDRLQAEELRLYVRAYTEDDDGRPSNATQRKRYRHARAWLNWCVDEGFIDRSPLENLTQPKKEEKEAAFLKPEDVDRLLVAIEHHMETTTDAVGRTPDLGWLADVIRVAVATGLRRGELVALRWQDVDLNDQRLHVRHRGDFTTKNSRERRVPLRGGALEVLRRMDAE